jgi:hypothetical protein
MRRHASPNGRHTLRLIGDYVEKGGGRWKREARIGSFGSGKSDIGRHAASIRMNHAKSGN